MRFRRSHLATMVLRTSRTTGSTNAHTITAEPSRSMSFTLCLVRLIPDNNRNTCYFRLALQSWRNTFILANTGSHKKIMDVQDMDSDTKEILKSAEQLGNRDHITPDVAAAFARAIRRVLGIEADGALRSESGHQGQDKNNEGTNTTNRRDYYKPITEITHPD